MTAQKNLISLEQLQTLLLPLSHDLKNHLTNISLYAQMMQKKAQTDEERKYSEKILKNVTFFDEHLTVVGEVLKVAYGVADEKPRKELVQSVMKQLCSLVVSENCIYSPSIDGTVECDLSRLEKTVKVLLSLYSPESRKLVHSIENRSLRIDVSGELHSKPYLPNEVVELYLDVVSKYSIYTIIKPDVSDRSSYNLLIPLL